MNTEATVQKIAGTFTRMPVPTPALAISSSITFSVTHSAAGTLQPTLRHFHRMVDDYRKGDWEDAVTKSGKFVEAVLKVLWIYVGETVPSRQDLNVGTMIDNLQTKRTFPKIRSG